MACTETSAEVNVYSSSSDSCCTYSLKATRLLEGSPTFPSITRQGAGNKDGSYFHALEAMGRISRAIDANGNFVGHKHTSAWAEISECRHSQK
eukprot:755964-Hanusia_phi.AAC.2